MIGTFYINGEVSDGRIPITDSSVLRGDGCFEVIRSYRGEPFGLAEHLDRLEISASRLGIPLPDRVDLADWIASSASELGDCVVRVVVTRGSSVPGLDDPPRVIVFSHTWDMDQSAARLFPVIAPWHAAGTPWELSGAKIISYAPNLAATRRAQAEGFEDALLLTTDGTILEGPTFSIAWVVDGVLETPSLELGILDSITRKVVLASAGELDLDVVEGAWALDRLAEASEAMAFSTMREVQPVGEIGDLGFDPGPVTKSLAEAFDALIHDD